MNLVKSVYAQVDLNDRDVWQFADPQFPQSLGGFISYLLPKILLTGGIIFFFLTVIAGFGVVRSAGSGDAHASEQARNFLTYAVIGLIIMLGAFGILQVINFLTFGSLSGPQGIL